MKAIPFLTALFFVLCLQNPVTAQVCDNCRYLSYSFDSVAVSTEQFGQGVNADGQNQQLFMDIYEPYGDTLASRPLVIFAFGGGFIQGSRDENYVVNACNRFAKAGYVAAAIDYRIGFSIPGLFPNPTDELMRVFFRAMQDMRGSVQWFRHHADQEGNSYRIDPDRVYIGGASAGAITAILTTYCDKSSEFEEMGSISAIDQLGGFNSSSGLYPGYSWEPQGVFNIAGAIVSTEWIEPGDPPILSSHGDQDGTVPYQGGNINFGFATLGLEGSYNIDQHADSIGVCSYLYTIVGGDHPSGSAPVTYFDEIFLRALPRMHALVNDRSFCCPLELDLTPELQSIYSLGDTIQLAFNVTNDSGNAQTFYCGSSCTPTSTDVMNDFVSVGIDGNYYLIGIATEGNCQATDFSYLDQEIAIAESQAGMLFTDFRLFPNPASREATLVLGNAVTGITQVRLRDLSGKLLLERSTSAKTLHFETGELANGVYFLELENKGRIGRQKIILQ